MDEPLSLQDAGQRCIGVRLAVEQVQRQGSEEQGRPGLADAGNTFRERGVGEFKFGIAHD
jgi:hypothetical protein